MEELKVEQTQEQSTQMQTVEIISDETKAEEQAEQTVSYGKFKDATALLNAYNALESEFTKRCQRIKELEAGLKAVDKDVSPTETEKASDKEQELLSDADKDNILKGYLKDVLAKKRNVIVLDGVGVGVRTPTERPKTIEQAGMLAKQIFNK